MNIACIIAYDGSRFCGFINGEESLSESKPSIKGAIERALKRIGIDTSIIASGRTDKYVHATYQVINFHTNLSADQMPLQKMTKLLNDRLYPHIFIRHASIQDDTFHARFHAKMRFYKYIFSNDNVAPFLSSYISHLSFGSIENLRLAISQFMGTHDFSMFKKNGSDSKDYIRQIYKANIFSARLYGIDCLIAHIGANGFLRSQVRIMLKACIEFSKGNISLLALQRQIDNDHSLHSPIRELAPPYGLYLTRVVY